MMKVFFYGIDNILDNLDFTSFQTMKNYGKLKTLNFQVTETLNNNFFFLK